MIDGMKIYKTFRPIIKPLILPLFKDSEKYLKQARINKDLTQFVGEAFFYSLIIAFLFGFFGFMLGLFIVYLIQRPDLMIISIFLAIVFSLIGFPIGIIFFKLYPIVAASARAKKIENALYLATIYMATIASSGASPLAIFTLLAKYKEFSEISKEASDILYLVKGLGLDLPTALHLKAQYSPSREWKELLEGIRSIIIEGGDLENFLYEKARQYIQDFKRKLLEYTTTLQVILEIYITLIVVGVIFIIILTTLLGSIMGGDVETIKQIQIFLIVFLLPAATMMFILLLKAMSPFES